MAAGIDKQLVRVLLRLMKDSKTTAKQKIHCAELIVQIRGKVPASAPPPAVPSPEPIAENPVPVVTSLD